MEPDLRLELGRPDRPCRDPGNLRLCMRSSRPQAVFSYNDRYESVASVCQSALEAVQHIVRTAERKMTSSSLLVGKAPPAHTRIIGTDFEYRIPGPRGYVGQLFSDSSPDRRPDPDRIGEDASPWVFHLRQTCYASPTRPMKGVALSCLAKIFFWFTRCATRMAMSTSTTTTFRGRVGTATTFRVSRARFSPHWRTRSVSPSFGNRAATGMKAERRRDASDVWSTLCCPISGRPTYRTFKKSFLSALDSGRWYPKPEMFDPRRRSARPTATLLLRRFL